MKITKLLQATLLAAIVVTSVPIISQAEVTYEEQDSGTNMGQSFTGSAKVVYGDTPSFTVKIPKAITLDSTGAAKYTVGVKGKIPSKYVVSVIPDETITMEEENNLLDSIVADVAAEKITWLPTELTENTYTESTNNTIQMRSIDFAKFNGTLNFNVSAEVPKVELKDASDEVKAANNFIGVWTIDANVKDSFAFACYSYEITEGKMPIIYFEQDFSYTYWAPSSHANYTENLKAGYYKALFIGDGDLEGEVSICFLSNDGEYNYLGESFPV